MPLRALLLALLLAAPAALAAADPGAAVDFLRATQAPDGGWGRRADTDWAMLGLAAAGEDPRAWGVETHLAANPPDPLSLLAWERATLALACAGFDARSFHGVDHALVVELHFTGTQFGNPTWLHDDFWAILALRAAGVPAGDVRIRLSAEHVMAGQSPSGGWSWSAGGAPDADDTGAALMALAASGHPQRGIPVERALAWLDLAQRPDGGWGPTATAATNVMSTAWVAMGLIATGEDPGAPTWTQPGGGPLDALAALQRPDGSFALSASSTLAGPVTTATALVPLSGGSYVCGAAAGASQTRWA